MSNPYAPPGGPYPGPSHPAYPSPPAPPQQAWPPQQPLGYAPPARGGLAIAAVVMSGLALLGVIGMGVFMVVGVAMGPSWALQGSITAINGEVAAAALERELTAVIEDDGGWVDALTCPATSPVSQGSVTVCHGEVDGFDWTGIVVFEDRDGSFTLTQP